MAVKKRAKPAAGGDEGLAQVEKVAGDAYGSLGVGRFKAWLHAYFHPYQAYADEKKNAEFGSSVATLAYIGLVKAVVAIIVMALILAFALPIIGIPFTVAGAIVILIAYPIMSVVGGIIVSLIYFIMAKLLGGTGGIWQQTYGMALVSGGILLMMLPFDILQVVPLVGWIFALAGLAAALYGIISQYRMIRAVHGLSQLRAIVVLVVPIILIAALVFLVIGMAAIAALGAYGTVVPVK